MIKKLKNIAPFIMIAYSLLFAISSYFKFYLSWYRYLPDLLGYSIFTSLFMLSVYMNRRYCTSTKIAVVGLILLNFINLLCISFNLDSTIYDIYLLIIVLVILTFYKIN